MHKPKILVTGATGKTGATLVAELRRHEWPVRAMVSREDARSASLQRLGAEIVVADMYDPQQLFEAIQGTQRAYYLPLMRPYMVQAATAFAVAARQAKLESIVQMSQWTSSASHPAVMTRQTWLVDRLFSMIPGVAHILFNPGMFADNFLRVMDFAALLGLFPVLMGDSKCAPISNEDMARCAAALLMDDPAKHAGKSYRPTGTDLLSGKDMAGIIARVVGHGVLPVNLPTWMFRKVARMQKIDPFQIYVLLKYVEDNKQGAFSYEGGVTQVMQDLTGRPAESFETTARRYAAMPFARQTCAIASRPSPASASPRSTPATTSRPTRAGSKSPFHPGPFSAWRMPIGSSPAPRRWPCRAQSCRWPEPHRQNRNCDWPEPARFRPHQGKQT